MSQLEEELKHLKNDTIGMWKLCISQIRKIQEALITFDKDLAHEVVANEKRVNGSELKIDRDCENLFALFNPVAVDLRFVLAVLKINSNLERTGDIAEGIGKFIVHAQKPFDSKILELTQVIIMIEEASDMLQDVLKAFETEDTKLARSIFKRDELLNVINFNAHSIVANYIKQNPEDIEQGLYILSTIRKLERVGDHCKNIAEEIIFYVEAKVLKHIDKMKEE